MFGVNDIAGMMSPPSWMGQPGRAWHTSAVGAGKTIRRRAAAVIPRDKRGQVLVGRRTDSARSYPRYLAFPGGGVDDTDEALPLVNELSDGSASIAERACAMRELGEEVGHWFVTDKRGAPARGDKRARFVDRVERGDDILDILRELELFLDDSDLLPLGLWITADSRPKTFAVRQFLLPLDPDDPRVVRTAPLDELDGIHWTSPADLCAQWHTGEALLLPPIRHVVTTLARCVDHALPSLIDQLKRVRPEHVPETQDIIQGLYVQPFRTPTLPPATHTNTVLFGKKTYFIIDPATPYDDERARFDALVALLRAQGRRPVAVLLTHHHHDHTGDAARVAKKYGLPIWAHADTGKLCGLPLERALGDGDDVTLPDDDGTLTALYTPGHADGHLAFYDAHSRTLIAGDLVASTGSILIDPPEGHLGTYLESLRRTLALPFEQLVPSHGPLLADGRKKIEEQIAHRQARQDAVREALRELGAATPEDIVAHAYQDVPQVMWPLAARSVLASLIHLGETGACHRDGDRFVAD